MNGNLPKKLKKDIQSILFEKMFKKIFETLKKYFEEDLDSL